MLHLEVAESRRPRHARPAVTLLGCEQSTVGRSDPEAQLLCGGSAAYARRWGPLEASRPSEMATAQEQYAWHSFEGYFEARADLV